MRFTSYYSLVEYIKVMGDLGFKSSISTNMIKQYLNKYSVYVSSLQVYIDYVENTNNYRLTFSYNETVLFDIVFIKEL